MSESLVPPFVPDLLQALGVVLSADGLSRCGRYLDLLLETNKQFNLTAIREPDAAWRRHIVDSLTVLPGLAGLAAGGRVIDIGSGGGLPGIPLAIARPDLRFTLLEATGKKARFLERCATELPLPNVTVLNQRAEAAGQDPAHRQRYDAAVCRAIGPLRELLEYAMPLVRVGGVLYAMKGPSIDAELEQASDALHILGAGETQVITAYPEGAEMQTTLVIIAKERPTPKTYPRSAGTPRQTPL